MLPSNTLEERALDVGYLLSDKVVEVLHKAIQSVVDLQEAYRRLYVVTNKLRADWENEYRRAEKYQKLYEETQATQKQLKEWFDGR